jgi:hypothetical protein
MNWLKYFEHNRDHRAPIPWEDRIDVAPHLRKVFIRSLQKFQIGESGEGRHLRKLSAATGNAEYAAAMELFIREEQRHAELMAGILKRMNASLLTSDWTDNCFMFMRHMSGLHTELLVVLMPEMIARVYFDALRRGFPNPAMNAVFTQIVQDEEGHLAFHVDFLNELFSNLSFARRIAVQTIWRLAFRAVCVVVYYDHGSLLGALGSSPKKFWDECGRVFDEVAAKIFSPAHVLCPPDKVAAQLMRSSLLGI